jgi:transcriptional regulator with XRE-family HTH domain
VYHKPRLHGQRGSQRRPTAGSARLTHKVERPRPTDGRGSDVRRRRGLTQRELATAAQVSESLIKKVEQGQITDMRLETARKVAVALNVPTMDIVSPERPEHQEAREEGLWAATRSELLSPQEIPDDDATGEGITYALLAAVKLYHANRYGQLAQMLPLLIRDARTAPPLIRSRVMQLAGSVMTQTAQRDAARVALEQSVGDAEATGNTTDAASAIVTMCWLMLTEGRFEDVRRLAADWADRTEPRLSTATVPEISVWGWLLLRGSAAAIRDNRPGEAADMMTLAEAAAVATRTERKDWQHYWITFGPATVAMKRTENALIDGRPDIALRLASRVPGSSALLATTVTATSSTSPPPTPNSGGTTTA